MTIREFLAKNNLKVYEMAKDIGITDTYLSQISRGKVFPSKRLMQDIQSYTDGAVTYRDFFDIVVEPKKVARRTIEQIKEDYIRIPA